MSTIRYPGGNFVSGFRWEDAIGPRGPADPPRPGLALDGDQRGGDRRVRRLAREGRQRADVRRQPRHPRRPGGARRPRVRQHAQSARSCRTCGSRTAESEPHAIRMWCLGNEMDGPWQLGHRSADDYGKLASQTAKAMRQLDPSLELVVCGSSHAHMPTFGSWEHTVLKHTYDDVDYISCHAYYEEIDGRRRQLPGVRRRTWTTSSSRLSPPRTPCAPNCTTRSGSTSHSTSGTSGTSPAIGTTSRSPTSETGRPRRGSSRTAYSVLDAVVVGNLLISLLKHADRVTSASLAQLVNVIAPIMTEPGGDAWRQTTFFPFAMTSRLAVGSSLLVKLESDTYQTDLHGEVPTTPSSQAIAIRTRRRPGSSSDSQRGSLRTRWARASRLALSRRQRWPGRRP